MTLDVATIIERLEGTYGPKNWFQRNEPLKELIQTVLSQHTSDLNAERAFGDLWAHFGRWDAIAAADAILLAPSNPFVSIGPILAVRGVRRALRAAPAPIVAISPLIGGRSVRGPADRMMRALGVPCGPAGIAALFPDLLDGIVVDDCDLASARRSLPASLAITATNLLMTSPARSRGVAGVALQLARSLARPDGKRP